MYPTHLNPCVPKDVKKCLPIPLLASNSVKYLASCILEKSSSVIGSLQCWHYVFGQGKSEVYRLVFQLLSTDLPTQLAHLLVLLLCIRILSNSCFSLSGTAIGIFLVGVTTGSYVLIDSNVVDFRECDYFTESLYSSKKLRF